MIYFPLPITTKLIELAPDIISEIKLKQQKPLLVEIPDRHGDSMIGETIDKYVSEGWEGLVIRRVDSVYKPGSRTNDWLKIKEYFEAEYPIKGISEGLREEDMCFILETPEGKRFNCKPMGDRALKQWYREHIDELIDKPLTIKYFEMSNASGSPVPQQPCGICVRDYE